MIQGTDGRRISVHEAQIKTAEIKIRTLTIGKRQVTLNVFRQLQREDLIDPETAELNGVPWGIVNYFPPKECNPGSHLHVVWQKGEELRRACVYKYPRNELRNPRGFWSNDSIRAEGLNDKIRDLILWREAWLCLASLNTGGSYRPTSWDTLNQNYKVSENDGPFAEIRFNAAGYGSALTINIPVDYRLYRIWQDNPALYTAKPPEYQTSKGGIESYPDDNTKIEETFEGYEYDEDGNLVRKLEKRVDKWQYSQYRQDWDWSYEGRESVTLPATEEDKARVINTWNTQQAELHNYARTKLEKLIGDAGLSIDADSVDKRARQIYDEMISFEDRWKRHYTEIEALDQLFIAT